MTEDDRLRAALRCARVDDEPPADWTAQLVARVPAPGRALPPVHEVTLWLCAWLLLLALALGVALVALEGSGWAATWKPLLPWVLCATVALIPAPSVLVRSRRPPVEGPPERARP
jgi:hypothetical protein